MNLIYPTMVTPFTDGGEVDFASLERFIGFLLDEGADGLFAVCQSSEMFDLSLEEKIDIAGFVRKNCRCGVVASGHTQKGHDAQVEAMKKMADTGVNGVVLLSNAFADEDEGDDVFISNLDRFLNDFREDIPLGIYECPHPYKRLLSERELAYLTGTGRFRFFKDTSCNADIMKGRLDAIGDSGMLLFNANVETVAKTASMGAAGFSGVLGNVTVKLIRFLMEDNDIHKVSRAQKAIDELSEYARNSIYPVCAKALLRDMGVFSGIYTRVKNHMDFSDKMLIEGKRLLDAVRELESEYVDAKM